MRIPWRFKKIRPLLIILLVILSDPLYADEVFHPSVNVPEFDSISGDDYYPLLLEWTQKVKAGSMNFMVSYMDPKVIIAQIKNDEPNISIQNNKIKKSLGGFPLELQIIVAYQAETSAELKPDEWTLSLSNGKDKKCSPEKSVIIQSPELKSGSNSQWWEESVIYTFQNSENEFFPPKASELNLEISSSSGETRAIWPFNESMTTKKKSSGQPAYIPIVGWILIAICVMLIFALWKIKAPRG